MSKTLYLVATNKCQMNCPFCYTKFVSQFDINSKDLNPDTVVKYLKSHNEYNLVVFHGGEPLLVADNILKILDAMKDEKIEFTIQTNLAFRELSKSQIEVLCRMSHGYGTSYSFDRFDGNEDQEKYWMDNIGFLNSMGIHHSILITVTESQIYNQSPKSLKNYMDEIGYDTIILERPIFKLSDIRADREKYALLYEKIDNYMKECFDIFPKDRTNLLRAVKDSIMYKKPLYPIRCSSWTDTLYRGKLKHGCPSLEKINVQDNNRNAECLQCPYFKYCMGDCECMNIVCAFPKNTFRAVSDYLKEEQSRKEMNDLGL